MADIEEAIVESIKIKQLNKERQTAAALRGVDQSKNPSKKLASYRQRILEEVRERFIQAEALYGVIESQRESTN